MPEYDLIPLSALQHYLYCPRQCALIHIERVWADNRFTAEGQVLHEHVNEASVESRGPLRTLRALDIVSRTLGLVGKADVVEVKRAVSGAITYCPVEYKRGKPKRHRADEVQLCAQAICLEEMFDVAIAEGALFYGQPRRRYMVALDCELRALTARVASETRALFAGAVTPPPAYEPRKCDACSLIAMCMPKRLTEAPLVARWIASRVRDSHDDAPCDAY